VCIQLLERKVKSSGSAVSSPISKPHVTARTLTNRFRTAIENPAIKSARNGWEVGINEELVAIATEKDRPFALLMPEGTEIHPHLEDESKFRRHKDLRFLFDSEDLLETMIAIGASKGDSPVENTLGMLSVALATPTSREFAALFPEMSFSIMQCGLDDAISSNVISRHNALRYTHCRLIEAEDIINGGSVHEARNYLKRGCPPSLRSKMWRMAFNLPPQLSKKEIKTFKKLSKICCEVDLLTDDLFVMDANSVSDDARYFVFGEYLREVVLCFSRDEWVLKNCRYQVHKPLLGMMADSGCKQYDLNTAAPPCGIQPFLGLSAYFAPLCFLCDNSAELYSLCRSSFCRVWSQMNVISGDKNCLLFVCKTFESLLMQTQMNLYLHLVKLGINPLQIALPWLQLGFVGYLEVSEILILWDRVFGFMDTSILAGMAVAIFIYRAQALFDCTRAADVHRVLQEGNNLRVVPLLQLYLFIDAGTQPLSAR